MAYVLDGDGNAILDENSVEITDQVVPGGADILDENGESILDHLGAAIEDNTAGSPSVVPTVCFYRRLMQGNL